MSSGLTPRTSSAPGSRPVSPIWPVRSAPGRASCLFAGDNPNRDCRQALLPRLGPQPGPADKARSRKNRKRSNRQASVATSCHIPCIHRESGTRQTAYARLMTDRSITVLRYSGMEASCRTVSSSSAPLFGRKHWGRRLATAIILVRSRASEPERCQGMTLSIDCEEPSI